MATYRIARRISAAAGVLESFIGVESSSDRPVIAKRLVPPWVKESAAFGPRFVRTLASLRSPRAEGLPDWVEVGTGRESTWLVQALTEGESLRTVMNALAAQKGFISPSEGLGVVGQVAALLQHLHARATPVVHGDLCASNVMLTPDGQVLLSDAGVTLFLSPSNQVGPARAEAFTLAPEQLTETPTQATDLFRLGLLLYELAMGHPLFYAPDPVQSMVLCQRFMGLARDAVKQVPEPWQSIIIDLLAVDPRERPTAADAAAVLAAAAERAGWKAPTQERSRLFARACGNRQTLDSLARGGTQELVLVPLVPRAATPAKEMPAVAASLGFDDTSDEPTTGIFSALPGTPPAAPNQAEPQPTPTGAISPGATVVGRISMRKMSHAELAAARLEVAPPPPPPTPAPQEDPTAPKDHRIGELLVDKQRITPSQLDEALDQVKRFGGTLADALSAIGACDEDDIVTTVAEVTHTPHTTSKKLAELPTPVDAMKLVPFEIAQQLDLVPLGLKGGTQLLVAMKDPMDAGALERLKVITGLKSVVAMRGGENAIRRARNRFYTGKDDDTPDWLDRGGGGPAAKVPDVLPHREIPLSSGSSVITGTEVDAGPVQNAWEFQASSRSRPAMLSLDQPAGRLTLALLAMQGERGLAARTLSDVVVGLARRLGADEGALELVRFASVSVSVANFVDGRPAWDVPTISSLSGLLGESGWNAIEPVVTTWLDWPAPLPTGVEARAVCLAFAFAMHAGQPRPMGSKAGGALVSFKSRFQLDQQSLAALMAELGVA